MTLRVLAPGIEEGFGLNLLADGLAILLGLFWLLGRSSEKQWTIPVGWLGILCLWLFLAVALSPLVAGEKSSALSGALAWLGQLVLFLVARAMARVPELERLLLRVLLAAGLSMACYGIFQRYYALPYVQADIEKRPEALRIIPPEQIEEFQWRLESNEPFGTFTSPNALAGFLFMILPIFVAAGMSAWRVRKARTAAFLAAGGILVWAIVLTGSRGAWMTGSAALALVGLAFLWGKLKRRGRAILGGGVVVVALAILAGLVGWDILRLRDPETSAGVRVGYNLGAMRILAEHPFLGVGLGNFGHHYPRVMEAEWGETIHVHNNVLEVASELGMFGLLPYVGIWYLVPLGWLVGRSGREKREARPSEERSDPIGLESILRPLPMAFMACSGGLAACFFIDRWEGLFHFWPDWPLLGACLFGFVWLLGFAFFGRLPLERGSWLRPALWGAVLAGIAHSLVDIDFQVRGISQVGWILLALLYAGVSARTWCTVRCTWRPAIRQGAVLALGVPLVVAIVWWMPRLMRADASLGEGRDLLRSGSGNVVDIAVERLESAVRDNPLDPAGWLWLATAYHAFDVALGEGFDKCLSASQRAIDLSPKSAALWACKGRHHADHASRVDPQAGTGARPYGPRLDEEHEGAERCYREAVARYPANPIYRYGWGQALERLGRQEEALVEFREALRMDAEIRLERRKLRPETVRELREKLARESKE